MSANFSLPSLVFKSQQKSVEPVSEFLYNKNIWIIGGTGIVGTWLTSRIMYESQKNDLNTKLWISSRDISNAKKKFQDYKDSKINYLNMTEYDMESPKSSIDLIIFGATPSKSIVDSNEIEFILQSTYKILNEIKKHCDYNENTLKILNISSGAAISRDTKLGDFIPEIRPDHDRRFKINHDWYSLLKRNIELEFLDMVVPDKVAVCNARLFNVTGYGLPLDSHFVWAQFMRSCLKRVPPRIFGNSRTERSFLSLDEASVALLLCATSKFDVVNVGGLERVDMQTLNDKFCEHFNLKKSNGGNQEIQAGSYVPELNNLKKLGFFQERDTDFQITQHHKMINAMGLI